MHYLCGYSRHDSRPQLSYHLTVHNLANMKHLNDFCQLFDFYLW